MAAPVRRSPEAPPRRGRRPVLSLEVVVDAAVDLLDQDGEQALTLRALAATLGTGVGSLYHYVQGRDELLDRATDAVLHDVLEGLDLPDEPYAALRSLSVELYRAMQAHPWAGLYLMRNTALQSSSMRLFDLFGRQTQQLDLTTRQRFDAVSSLVSFVVGTGAEMRELPPEVVVPGKTQAAYLAEFAQLWRELDPQEFPFVHEVADTFAAHDDAEQFAAGVDLFLAGLRVQAEG